MRFDTESERLLSRSRLPGCRVRNLEFLGSGEDFRNTSGRLRGQVGLAAESCRRRDFVRSRLAWIGVDIVGARDRVVRAIRGDFHPIVGLFRVAQRLLQPFAELIRILMFFASVMATPLHRVVNAYRVRCD